MCGIAGYIGHEPREPRHVDECLALMRNRGPDHQQAEVLKHGDVHVALLHSRLSIIDPDPRSHQPMTIGPCTLVFNGEIYNYLEVRADLQARGQRFVTNSDTEVLLRSYLTWGLRCVEHFEGMWAFAVYDRRCGRLTLSRDRFGEKPLYLHESPGGLLFGSEVKFIAALRGQRPPVDRRHVARYLANGYRALHKTTQSFFSGIAEVPRAHHLVVGVELTPRISRYWSPTITEGSTTLAEAVQLIRHRLLDSLRIRLRADVPVAFCLSGGVDSAGLASMASKELGCDVAAFSIIDPDPRYNERQNIEATIGDLDCRYTIVRLERTRSLDHLRRLVVYHDAPVYTISYYVHSLLSVAMSQQGYRVAISGTGADELFAGYYDHFNLLSYDMRDHAEHRLLLQAWASGSGRYVRNPLLQDPKRYCKDPAYRGHLYDHREDAARCLHVPFDEGFAEELLAPGLLRNRMLNELFYEVVPCMLHEDDLNSMSCSVENRSPYLDTRLFQAAFDIPAADLIREGRGKHVLREALRGILNDSVRLDERKVGFNASIASVFDLRSAEVREQILDDGPIYEIVRRDAIERLLQQEPQSGSRSKFLFGFLSARLFMDQFASRSQTRARTQEPAAGLEPVVEAC